MKSNVGVFKEDVEGGHPAFEPTPHCLEEDGNEGKHSSTCIEWTGCTRRQVKGKPLHVAEWSRMRGQVQSSFGLHDIYT